MVPQASYFKADGWSSPLTGIKSYLEVVVRGFSRLLPKNLTLMVSGWQIHQVCHLEQPE